jgi:two-component system, chemotaxis family, protein-glutamate methylesterase/glutaminase
VNDYALIAIGGSWGGLVAVSRLFRALPRELELPVALVLHRSPESSALCELLQAASHMTVVEADDKQPIERNHVYVAPPDYHLLVEHGVFALSTDERVQYARPSIDVLFESAADTYGDCVIGIVLTGSNEDGARGLAAIKDSGGVAIVQRPEEAEKRAMPDAAIAATHADAILSIDDMGKFLYGLTYTPLRAATTS